MSESIKTSQEIELGQLCDNVKHWKRVKLGKEPNDMNMPDDSIDDIIGYLEGKIGVLLDKMFPVTPLLSNKYKHLIN